MRAGTFPHFAFEYMDGGAGADTGIAHNWAALDAVELVPRYGVMPSLPPIDVELFGRKYAAPIGIAPMGGPALVWPGADAAMARAAQRARVPYTLGTVGGMTIEEAGELAPDVFWFQLYRMARNDHALGFDLVRRAEAAGAHVLVLTIDVPVRTTRPREVAVGLGGGPFRPDLRMIARHAALARLADGADAARPAQIRQYQTLCGRECQRPTRSSALPAARWAALSPGTRSPASATAGSGRWCSRASCIRSMPQGGGDGHRGHLGVEPWRPPDRGAAAADRRAARHRGARSAAAPPSSWTAASAAALDVVRAVALGAQAAFAGKAFLWGLGALGEAGPEHVIELLIAEASAALGQIGAHSLAAGALGRDPPSGGVRLSQEPAGLARCRPHHVTSTLLNCQGSLVSRSSGNRPPRPSSGVQSVYWPITGPR